MPFNSRGQRNVARKEAARQKKLTRRLLPQKKLSGNKYAYYVSKRNRARREARSTRKASKKQVNIKKIIGRLIVLLFQLKIDPASLAKRNGMFSDVDYNVSRFGAKTPYKFPFPPPSKNMPTTFCKTESTPTIAKSAPLLLGAPPCPGTKETKVNEGSLVTAAAAIALKFCPATQYDVELFRPVCLDPKIQNYAREWAEKAGVGVVRLKNKDPEDDFCRLNEKGQDKCDAGLGVPRILMPSLDDPSSFLNRIHRQFHINYTEETAKMSNLIPAQGEIRQSRAEGAAKGMDPETGLVEVGKNKNGSPIYASPIIISQDNYIIDGHHRWAAAYKLGLEDRSIPVIRIHAPITSILMAGALEPTNPF